MNPPAILRAVQTTPPITIAATMPALPLRPTATSTRAVMMSVMMVIPLTGLLPTMAMALAATVVKRKEMTATISRPVSACQTLSTTPPKAKKANTASSAITIPVTTVFILMSRSLSSTASADPLFLPNSLPARPMALLMTPAFLMMPMMPAVAMPPIPI